MAFNWWSKLQGFKDVFDWIQHQFVTQEEILPEIEKDIEGVKTLAYALTELSKIAHDISGHLEGDVGNLIEAAQNNQVVRDEMAKLTTIAINLEDIIPYDSAGWVYMLELVEPATWRRACDEVPRDRLRWIADQAVESLAIRDEIEEKYG